MFAKVFQSLWQGSLVGRSDAQLVFVFLLAHADSHGEVDYYPPVITALTGIPEDRVRSALLELESTDEKSRIPEEEGRRIIRIDEHRDWGWRIVNYAKYREIRDAETRRHQVKEAVRRYRAKQAGVSDVSHGEPRKAQVEVEVELEPKDLLATLAPATSDKTKKAPYSERFEEFWGSYLCERRRGKPEAWSVWKRLGCESLSETVMAALTRFRSTDQWPKFAPEPSRWLKKQEWVDGPVTATKEDGWS